VAVFSGVDGTRLSYQRLGRGPTVVCLPGGPMQAGAYLGDLGGLSAHAELVLPDPRGTGESAIPADPGSYRCDRQVPDVEALRGDLGLERMRLLGHSAGASLALSYAAAHPERVELLVLVAPSPRALDVPITDLDRRQVAELRKGEPWFPQAYAAFERIWAGEAGSEDWEAITPFWCGRWDAAAQAHVAREASLRNDQAAAVFNADGAFDPPVIRAAMAALTAPVLLVAGEHDVALPPEPAAAYAGLFRRGELAVQPGAGHAPWLDDPERFVGTVAAFLARAGGDVGAD